MGKNQDERDKFSSLFYQKEGEVKDIMGAMPEMSKRTAYRWAEKLKKSGHLRAEKPTGRPEKQSELDLRHIKLVATRNP